MPAPDCSSTETQMWQRKHSPSETADKEHKFPEKRHIDSQK
jgi:hypothetical protein